ncbi:MAG: ABC transporter permease [Gemmatimonadota bacterium]|nr:ABC transporter permease [Gemmatimonadota bacterium]
MNTLLQDLMYAVRGLAKNRTFTLVAIFALALGVGANTAMFSVVNAVLLTDLPYPQADRLVMLWERHLASDKPHNVVGPANFLAWQESAKSFDAMGAFVETHGTVTGLGDEPISEQMRISSATVFPILGVQPALGRVYTVEEDAPGGPNVAVISYDMWKTRFGGLPGAVGRTFRLNGNLFTVLGVMSKDFHFFEPVDLWVPIGFGPKHRDAQGRYLRVVARLKPGVTVARANDEMLSVAKRRVQDAPKLNANWSANAVSLRENVVGDVRKGLLVLLGAVGFLLVIACANVANLLLARATDRQKEIAIRVSLGATPGRLVRQLLTESIVLSLVAAIAGLGLAFLGTDVIVALIPKDFPAIGDVAIDARVLAFTMILALLTGVAFGLAPAIATARGALHDTLKEGGRSGTALTRASGNLRNALVVAEVSLAIVLLAGAGLMLRSFSELRAVHLGFQPERAMMADLSLPRAKYRNDTLQVAFFHEAESRIAAIPGVKAVGAISFLPLSGQRSASSFTVAGRPAPPRGQEPTGDMRAVTPGYFRAMEIPIKSGRALTDADLSSSPAVAVVSETLARTFWPNESAVGKYIDYEWFKMEHVQIVGIAGDVHHAALDVEPFMEIYRPLTQFPYNFMTLVVRGTGEPSALASPLRDVVRSMDRDLPIGRMSPLTALVGESLGKSRLSTTLFGLFGAVGLVLATIGIYGVMSYGVMQRTREFGVRMALGARASDVSGMVVKQGARLTLMGVALGLAGAFALTRLMTSLLFGVAPTDPTTYVGIALLLGAVAMLASYLPARRATRVDPVIALRNE